MASLLLLFLWTDILPDDAGSERLKHAVVSNKSNIHNIYSCIFLDSRNKYSIDKITMGQCHLRLLVFFMSKTSVIVQHKFK